MGLEKSDGGDHCHRILRPIHQSDKTVGAVDLAAGLSEQDFQQAVQAGLAHDGC